jgi:hypothetical protein
MTPQDLTWTFPKQFFYLAGPYSKWHGGLDDASRVISEISGRLIQHGLPVFSPIAHSHAICAAAHMDFLSLDVWLPADEPLAIAAAGLIVADMDGWQTSYGVNEEIKWFRKMEKPCWLLDPVELELNDLPGTFG